MTWGTFTTQDKQTMTIRSHNLTWSQTEEALLLLKVHQRGTLDPIQ